MQIQIKPRALLNILCKLVKLILFIAFPTRCLNCNVITQESFPICKACNLKIKFITNDPCETINTNPFVNLQNKNQSISLLCALEYNEESSNLFKKFKFNNAQFFSKHLGMLMIEVVKDKIKNIDIIIPVPMHWIDLLKRGYNQSLLLAYEISKYYNKPLTNNVLIKKKLTKKQSRLSLHERETNLQNAFSISHETKIIGKNILLVDDIYTTGNTIHSCITILKQAKSITVLTLGRAKKKNKLTHVKTQPCF